MQRGNALFCNNNKAFFAIASLLSLLYFLAALLSLPFLTLIFVVVLLLPRSLALASVQCAPHAQRTDGRTDVSWCVYEVVLYFSPLLLQWAMHAELVIFSTAFGV